MFSRITVISHHHDARLQHRKVAIENRADDQFADPGKGEDDAKDDRAVDHAGGNVARHGDDGQSGVPQRVPVDEAARAEAARPRVLDEARGQHVDHRAPHDLRQNGDRREAERRDRKYPGGRGGATGRRHQPQLHGEDQDSDEREPEARDAAGGQREERHEPVEEAESMRRGEAIRAPAPHGRRRSWRSPPEAASSAFRPRRPPSPSVAARSNCRNRPDAALSRKMPNCSRSGLSRP